MIRPERGIGENAVFEDIVKTIIGTKSLLLDYSCLYALNLVSNAII